MSEPNGETGRPVGVLLVDDHGMVRRGLRAYLAEVSDLEVYGEAEDGQQALDRLAELDRAGRRPSVVLMDLKMPGMDGITAIAELRAHYPDVEVVALTSFVDESLVQGALRAGATGYLLKDASADALTAAIHDAARGRVHLDAAAARQLATSLQDRAPTPAFGAQALTRREREVLGLVAEGCSNHDIAARLVLSERTVRSHVSNILGKLGVSSRTQAAVWALQEGIRADGT